MKISSNSWHRKLNEYFFGNGYFREVFYDNKKDKWSSRDRQKNLCPYFWGTILAVSFVWLLFIVKHIGSFLEELIDKIPSVNWSPPSMSEDTKMRAGKIVGWLAVGFAFAGVMVYGALVSWGDIAWVIVYGGGLVIGILLAIILGFKVKDVYDDWREDHPKKDKPKTKRKPNMLKEFLVGWYHKHCPRLEWTND